jgi:hypothetical protein
MANQVAENEWDTKLGAMFQNHFATTVPISTPCGITGRSHTTGSGTWKTPVNRVIRVQLG